MQVSLSMTAVRWTLHKPCNRQVSSLDNQQRHAKMA
jgi:hypothetical protein